MVTNNQPTKKQIARWQKNARIALGFILVGIIGMFSPMIIYWIIGPSGLDQLLKTVSVLSVVSLFFSGVAYSLNDYRERP